VLDGDGTRSGGTHGAGRCGRWKDEAMPATMHDVARLAGVSIKTVSNVLNDYPHIRPATRQKVLSAVDELGYQVNITARNLRRGTTGMIGLALPELSLPYFAELADAVIDAAEARGLIVLIEQTGGVVERELDALHGARRKITDGLIFSPLGLGPEGADEIRDGLPLVLLGERIFSDRADHVTMRNVEAAHAATAYLVATGRRRIAAIGTHPGEVVGTAALRLEGYRRALAEAGIPEDEALLGEAGPWHRATGAAAVASIFHRGGRPDAVFAFNDAMALGAMHELQVRGVRVPDDVAVMGFDDVDDARYSTPALTSVDPGREEIARTAVDLLVERITTRSSPVERRRVLAPFNEPARGVPHPGVRPGRGAQRAARCRPCGRRRGAAVVRPGGAAAAAAGDRHGPAAVGRGDLEQLLPRARDGAQPRAAADHGGSGQLAGVVQRRGGR
jgi:DNA-binding LacI/PurR family transcriptional regulator